MSGWDNFYRRLMDPHHTWDDLLDAKPSWEDAWDAKALEFINTNAQIYDNIQRRTELDDDFDFVTWELDYLTWFLLREDSE